MANLTAYTLRLAFERGFSVARLDDGRWSLTDHFGDEHRLDATQLDSILPLACEWAGYDLQEEVEFFNSLRPEGADTGHPLGQVVNHRKTTVVGFLGDAGLGIRREVQVKLARDWTDNGPSIPEDYQAGDLVWVENPYPDQWPELTSLE